MQWFGTAGTVTRLHHDSYDNLLTQVFGYKYVRLYATSQTPKLYVIKPAANTSTTGQGNISAVDVESPDLAVHPLFASAVYMETILGPGDMLFIPRNVWHYVRGLTPSFSINFWF
jgi:ribosomal protein L16 Arg81 hydroxylase